MTLLSGAVWTITEDDGSGTTGTPGNAAWVAAVKASVEAITHSATNPTVSPANIIDEVVTARAAFLNLDARLDDIETDVGAIPSVSVFSQILGQQNLATNEVFFNWYAGDAVSPASWSLNGAGGTVARTGTGLADTTRKIGPFAARIRRVAASTTFTQNILNAFATTVNVEEALRGATVGYGAYLRSTSIAGGRLSIFDGVGTSFSAANAAANTWEWLTVERLINAAATELTIGAINDVNGADVYLSGPTAAFSAVGAPPSRWVPAPHVYVTYLFVVDGNAAVAASRFIFSPPIPGVVEHVQLYAGTAPTGADLIVDVNTWDGAAYTSMFASRPTIAAGTVFGGAEPDGTYARKCFTAGYGLVNTVGTRLSIDIDQVGSGVTGANISIHVRCRIPVRLFESVLDAGFF